MIQARIGDTHGWTIAGIRDAQRTRLLHERGFSASDSDSDVVNGRQCKPIKRRRGDWQRHRGDRKGFAEMPVQWWWWWSLGQRGQRDRASVCGSVVIVVSRGQWGEYIDGVGDYCDVICKSISSSMKVIKRRGVYVALKRAYRYVL